MISSFGFLALIWKKTSSTKIHKTIRSITCFSYILMILSDRQNKMADYYKIDHFVLMISLDLMKSSEVRKAGDRSKYNKTLSYVSFFYQTNYTYIQLCRCEPQCKTEDCTSRLDEITNVLVYIVVVTSQCSENSNK